MALPYAMCAIALCASTAGVIRGSRTVLHANHLAGLLFGCAYAIGTEHAQVRVASSHAANKDTAELE